MRHALLRKGNISCTSIYIAVTMAFTGQSRNLHAMAGIFTLDNLYLAGKHPFQVRDMLINFADILPETSKSSACWDMGRIPTYDMIVQ